MYLDECIQGGFIGADFDIYEDLTNELPENWRDFNKKYIPVIMSNVPNKTKIGAGLACGMLWTICRGISEGDVILSATGTGMYRVGHVTGEYYYASGLNLPHRREVKWSADLIARENMSTQLQRSLGSMGTLAHISKHETEIADLVNHGPLPSGDDLVSFVFEKYLEEFLVANWSATFLGKTHFIFEENGEKVGKQFPTDTGRLDILAVSNDKKELLVIELKRGKASDSVVGQIQRYMGYVKDELAEPGQEVRGLIIAFEDDLRLKRALSVTQNIDFYKYEVSFKLEKG